MPKKKLIAVINELSGNAKAAEEQKFLLSLAQDYDVARIYYIKGKNDGFDLAGCQAVAVYGGDGTLNSVLRKLPKDDEIEILYRPSGTLNELGKTIKQRCGKDLTLSETGVFCGMRFAYVAAAGTFTSIGVMTSTKEKKRVKFFAYFSDVLRFYKVMHIKADINSDAGDFSGEYTLMMFIDSNRCFGFRFNSLYKPNDGKLHMLLIRAPKGGGLFAKIKIFFPMFRVFFMGLRREIRTKNIVFANISSAQLKLYEPQRFCFDGECQNVGGTFSVGVEPLKSPIRLITYD